jgi:peroxiredoxin
MSIKIGDKLPSIGLQIMTDTGPQWVTTDDLFAGKKVAFFALPGAFTPSCSKAHLPGYVIHADAIKAKGVDCIICLSVNDVYVMNAWGRDQNVEDRVLMVADGNGDFTRAIGMEVDDTASGRGWRSRRYAMIVEDGVVTALNLERPKAFEVSSAEAMLKQL